MNQLMALLLPSIIGLKQCDKYYGKAKDKKSIIERYLICVMFINIFSYAISIYIFRQPDFIFTNQFTLKYLIMSSFFAYLLPVIYKFIDNNININIKVKKNEK